jgi:transmembrane sensor
VSGEALFEVKHDAGRPFQVRAGDLTLEDVGTQFDVYSHRTGATVSVLEGHVRAYCSCDNSSSSHQESMQMLDNDKSRSIAATVMELSAGDRVEISTSLQGPILRKVRLTQLQLEATAAWRDGKLIFDNTPLSEAVAQVNRYSNRKLVIDPSIADRTVGGTYWIGDADTFAATLAASLGIKILPPDPSDSEENVIRLVGEP